MTGLPEYLILERKIEELKMYCIVGQFYTNGLESCYNAGADELQVGEVIIRSTQDLKAHLVATNSEKVHFVGFACPYNILTCIQKRLRDE